MRLQRVRTLAGLIAVAILAVACGKDSSAPSGPFTFVPVSYIYNVSDTVHGTMTVDGTPLEIARDTLPGVARGTHQLTSQLDIEYLSDQWSENLDPDSRLFEYLVPYARSCRDRTVQTLSCANHSVVSWSGSRRLYCHVNDYGEFCTGYTDPALVGLRWPTDVSGSITDGYVGQGKLLIAAKAAAELGSAANHQMATALYLPGDYGPASRLRVDPADSSRWDARAWTDLRHKPLEGFLTPFLAYDDRPNDLFGLEVRSTYFLPSTRKDVLFIRFDVTNISNQALYRLVHPTAPAGGFTTRQIYLAPTLDVWVGAPAGAEGEDDNATMFPAESLMVGYDEDFRVTTLSTPAQPGMVGLRLLSAPAGTTARGLIAELADSLTYFSSAYETDTYKMLAAGREGAPRAGVGCSDRGSAYVCAPEGHSNVVMGWSVGPIAALAPGQSVSLTVAVMMASPAAGTYTTGTDVPPRNDLIGDTSRAIYSVAAPLRTLSGAIAGTTVTPIP